MGFSNPKAIDIPERILIDNANKVIDNCSTIKIDSDYIIKIKALINNKY